MKLCSIPLNTPWVCVYSVYIHKHVHACVFTLALISQSIQQDSKYKHSPKSHVVNLHKLEIFFSPVGADPYCSKPWEMFSSFAFVVQP